MCSHFSLSNRSLFNMPSHARRSCYWELVSLTSQTGTSSPGTPSEGESEALSSRDGSDLSTVAAAQPYSSRTARVEGYCEHKAIQRLCTGVVPSYMPAFKKSLKRALQRSTFLVKRHMGVAGWRRIRLWPSSKHVWVRSILSTVSRRHVEQRKRVRPSTLRCSLQ